MSQLAGIQHRPSGGSGSVNSFGSSAHAVQTGMSSGIGISGSALRTALSRCPSPAIVSAVTITYQTALAWWRRSATGVVETTGPAHTAPPTGDQPPFSEEPEDDDDPEAV